MGGEAGLSGYEQLLAQAKMAQRVQTQERSGAQPRPKQPLQTTLLSGQSDRGHSGRGQREPAQAAGHEDTRIHACWNQTIVSFGFGCALLLNIIFWCPALPGSTPGLVSHALTGEWAILPIPILNPLFIEPAFLHISVYESFAQ